MIGQLRSATNAPPHARQGCTHHTLCCRCVRVADRVAGGGWRVAKASKSHVAHRAGSGLAWPAAQFVIREPPLEEPAGWF